MELSGIDTGKGLRLVRCGSHLRCSESDSTAKPTTFRSSSDGGVISSNPQRSRRLFGAVQTVARETRDGHRRRCSKDEQRPAAMSSPVGIVWTLLSILLAGVCSVGFLQPFWFVNSATGDAIGLYRYGSWFYHFCRRLSVNGRIYARGYECHRIRQNQSLCRA